ncbi:MAG TPA: RNA-directed DNA polymerase [Candidatus Aphodousia gallistercoris]|nr:RNA-directed DNA polymerase [Candidatus Aphodousia gallistercoris]
MKLTGLERDQTDFILTDLLPVELSERFSFYDFYLFLMKPSQEKELNKCIQSLKEQKSKSDALMFASGWSSQPLQYPIMKGLNTYRTMSLIQPFSAMNVYLFITCYQKEILTLFEKQHVYSIRYHRHNQHLRYKSTQKKVITYFHHVEQRLKKEVVQQAGNYFKISPFPSINSFTDSHYWHECNFVYRYFAKIDYKLCFDSIYSHSFAQIIEHNVIDAKKAKNSNLYLVLDRLMQNINGHSSHGILVGPEFSRMVAEILLQHIDMRVLSALQKKGIVYKKDYIVYRYVDDIFIFANDRRIIDQVILSFDNLSKQYRLSLNESKLEINETPFHPKLWIERTRYLTDLITKEFYRGDLASFNSLPEDERFILKFACRVDRLKGELIALMKQYPKERRTIVSYLLTTLLNAISKKRDGYTLFPVNSPVKKATALLDFIFFIYAFFPSFEQTRKVISMLSYVGREVSLDAGSKGVHRQFSRLLKKYSFIFENGSFHDLCDWFPFFTEYEYTLPIHAEECLIDKAKELNDPIIYANLLLYARYDKKLFKLVKKIVQAVLQDSLEKVIRYNGQETREFWYLLIFYNCPFLDDWLKDLMFTYLLDNQNKLTNLKGKKDAQKTEITNIVKSILLSFMLSTVNTVQKDGKHGFFRWGNIKNFSDQVTYKTYKRTLFRNFKKKSYGIYVSID